MTYTPPKRVGFVVGDSVMKDLNARMPTNKRIIGNTKDFDNIRVKSYIKPSPKPRSAPNFSYLRALEIEQMGQKVNISPETLQKMFQIKVPDPSNPNILSPTVLTLGEALKSVAGSVGILHELKNKNDMLSEQITLLTLSNLSRGNNISAIVSSPSDILRFEPPKQMSEAMDREDIGTPTTHDSSSAIQSNASQAESSEEFVRTLRIVPEVQSSIDIAKSSKYKGSEFLRFSEPTTFGFRSNVMLAKEFLFSEDFPRDVAEQNIRRLYYYLEVKGIDNPRQVIEALVPEFERNPNAKVDLTTLQTYAQQIVSMQESQ